MIAPGGTQLCPVDHFRDPARPRRVAEGATLCRGCIDRLTDQLDRLPEVFDAVLAPKVGTRSMYTSGTSDPPAVVTDEQIEARHLVVDALVPWCVTVVEEREVSAPARDVESMCAFLRRHSLWLTAHEHAHHFAGEIDSIVRGAFRVAYPSKPSRTYIGDCPMHVYDGDGLPTVCGEPIYAYPETPDVACFKCDTVHTVEEWQRRIVGDAGRTVTGPVLLALLSARYMTPVERSTLKSWVHRGHVQPLFCLVKGRALVYDLDAVTAYTDLLWTPARRLG